ncbi:MAG: DUF2752 domain-containing protein [Bacteroidaceae bacterium]|nr:DUF2752 domain-containing protein [Bacteroidaceae bacterium]MDE6159209.1 DUF2752 domain-containing protein [Bacteroidaceae bacterium]
MSASEGQTAITVCPSKLVYHIPCPGCGVTRASLLFLKGQFLNAVRLNPNCLAAIFFLFAYPVIAFYSLLTRHSYIADTWEWGLGMLKKKWGLGVFLLCEAAIWIHNFINQI